MNLLNINISFSYWKLIILGCIALFFLGLIIWIICSYYTYKWFKMNIDKDYFYFNEYNSDCKVVCKRIRKLSYKTNISCKTTDYKIRKNIIKHSYLIQI